MPLASPTAANPDLWTLVLERTQIDPQDLADAITAQAANQPLDYRTRLLIRDSCSALRSHWSDAQFRSWLIASPHSKKIEEIAANTQGPPGFSLLSQRLMSATRRQTILQFLRELGLSLQSPDSISIGGSAALILTSSLSRRTEDIDVVDEVPAQVRSNHSLLADLAKRYGIHLAHFQSHYLPQDWKARTRSLGRFGNLDVHLVDTYDVLLSKLFSSRPKDRDDLRAIAPEIDKPTFSDRLKFHAQSFLADPKLLQMATDNWYILYDEPLPS